MAEKNAKVSIRDWYLDTYPDEKGKDIARESTFDDMLLALEKATNVDDVIGICDSLIRERCFAELARITDIPYTEIYISWLSLSPLGWSSLLSR